MALNGYCVAWRVLDALRHQSLRGHLPHLSGAVYEIAVPFVGIPGNRALQKV